MLIMCWLVKLVISNDAEAEFARLLQNEGSPLPGRMPSLKTISNAEFGSQTHLLVTVSPKRTQTLIRLAKELNYQVVINEPVG